MSFGFVMLCHSHLDRAAEVARHWAERDCPIVIHVDAKVSATEFAGFQQALSDLKNVQFSPRLRCEWGTWSLVRATKIAAKQLLKNFPKLGHVYLTSGSCLTLRPVSELQTYLRAHPQTDFIESVTTQDVQWTVGGLNEERFIYRFPFSWKRNRKLFDRYVALQRFFGLRRKIPKGLTPHLGSQWWCLTRQTLTAILTDPDAEVFDRYFRRVWIPDESYFQSLARRYAVNIESRSLTLSKFDFQGKPHVFYDDHLRLLRRSDCFLARKIWHKADLLYQTFLYQEQSASFKTEPAPGKIDRVFAKAVERRTRGRPGLYMHSRFPNWDWENGKTAVEYSVFHGFSELFEDFDHWLARRSNAQVHGHLFAPDRAEFSGGDLIAKGGLSASATLRDYNPEAFLAALIWNARSERQVFQFSARDRQKITPFIASDSNARIHVITGAWALPLFKSNRNFDEIRNEAAVLQRNEVEFISELRALHARAHVKIWSLTEFLEYPIENLAEAVAHLPSATGPIHLETVPRMVQFKGFAKFLQNLKNQGMRAHVVGDFPSDDMEMMTTKPSTVRPYVVR